MPEQPADREYGFALLQGEAGMGVTKIVKAHIEQISFHADLVPELFQPCPTHRPFRT